MKQYRPFLNSNELILEYKKRCNNEMIMSLSISEIPVFHKDGIHKHMLCFSPDAGIHEGFPFSQENKKSISDAVYLFNNYTFPDGSPCGVLYEI